MTPFRLILAFLAGLAAAVLLHLGLLALRDWLEQPALGWYYRQ